MAPLEYVLGKAGPSQNFSPQMRFPSTLARQHMTHPNFRSRPSEASRATRARDRAELPFFLCYPSGKMTCKIWPANSGLALSGSLNVRAWLARESSGKFRWPRKPRPRRPHWIWHGPIRRGHAADRAQDQIYGFLVSPQFQRDFGPRAPERLMAICHIYNIRAYVVQLFS